MSSNGPDHSYFKHIAVRYSGQGVGYPEHGGDTGMASSYHQTFPPDNRVDQEPAPSTQRARSSHSQRMQSHNMQSQMEARPSHNVQSQMESRPSHNMESQMEMRAKRIEDDDTGSNCCGIILAGFSWILVILFFPIAICMCLKIVQEYERAIIFRLGRALQEPKGPGLFFVLPCTDHFMKVDLRTVSFDVPPQEILTKDSVTVAVDAVVYYRIQDPMISVVNVEDAPNSTKLLAQTTLRNMLGMRTLSEILSDRDSISSIMQASLDEGTDPWGVKVERVEIKDVRLPQQLQRAMAAEAEAAREARAKVIAAEGEQKASRALKEAADVINESPSALQLRYLQTLTTISAEKNSTIIFPVPMDLLKGFKK